ncbi:MAG: hypothetical protein WC654_02645 [Patescibacteria group bacterium]
MSISFLLRSSVVMALLGLVLAFQASASLEDVSYPITELGSCASQDECFTYCGEPVNYDACIAYADANDLLEEEEIQKYQDTQALVLNGGPGGCTDQASCETYCGDIVNLEECLTFGSENGLMSEDELAEAQKVLAAIQSGVPLPSGCTSKESCDAYCGELENMQECMDFATAAGLMSEEDAAQAQKVLTIMQSGGTPGGCVSKDECDEYCSDPTHMAECIDFAVETGFMTAEEAENIKAEGGMGLREDFEGPGGCDSPESCSTYCSDSANSEECEDFALKMGEFEEGEFGEPEEGEMDFEYRGSFTGPGGCTGEEECGNYCSDSANSEECASFFGGEQRIDDEDKSDFEYDETREFDTEDQILGENDAPRDEWIPPSEFEGQNQIDEGFDYDELKDDGERYEYEGDEFQDQDIYYDDETPSFDEFTREDIPLDLGGRQDDGYGDAIEVTPEAGGFESGGGEFNGGEQGGGQTGGETGGGGTDAGLMNSVKRFFSRAVSLMTL